MPNEESIEAQLIKAKAGNLIRDNRIDALEMSAKLDEQLIEHCHEAIKVLSERNKLLMELVASLQKQLEEKSNGQP